jgi:hypothetical protein
VVLRCEPRGPPEPRFAGPPRPRPPAGPLAGAPGRAPANPVPPPGRDGPPLRAGPPVEGRGLIGRGPPEPVGRLDDGPPGPGGRRTPGGGGIGRPDGLMGRPGGGGIGRPDALIGGRAVLGVSPASPLEGRWVGRMVVGPSLGVTRGATGLGGAATRLRTTRGASTGASSVGAGTATTEDSTVAATCDTGVARASPVVVTFVLRVALDLTGSSGVTGRRRPSLSAFRRIRSAWASSIEAEGLDAPMPSVWASASNSLLVRPSSLESSCTRIFFCAKTFP